MNRIGQIARRFGAAFTFLRPQPITRGFTDQNPPDHIADIGLQFRVGTM